MSRISLLVSVVLLPLALITQAPSRPKIKPIADANVPKPDEEGAIGKKKRQDFVNSSCVCAVYPVWDDGEGNYLYSAEICEPATSCMLTDVAYYWESAMEYPKDCDPNGTLGNCDQCNPMRLVKQRPSVPDVPGLSYKFPKTVAASDAFPNRVPHPDTPTLPDAGNAGRPRFGVADEIGLLVSFAADMDPDPDDGNTIPRKPVVAKLLVTLVNPRAARAPNSADLLYERRMVCVGYEIDRNDLDQNDAIVSIPNSCVAIAARRFHPEDDQRPANPLVQEVCLGLNRFLVVLAKPDALSKP